jgi:hypothetical protein
MGFATHGKKMLLLFRKIVVLHWTREFGKIQNCGNDLMLPQIPNGLRLQGDSDFHPIAAIEAKCNLDFPLSFLGERNKEREISE